MQIVCEKRETTVYERCMQHIYMQAVCPIHFPYTYPKMTTISLVPFLPILRLPFASMQEKLALYNARCFSEKLAWVRHF